MFNTIKLPCDGYRVPPMDKFKLEDSPCRKCTIICPFDSILSEVSNALSSLPVLETDLVHFMEEV